MKIVLLYFALLLLSGLSHSCKKEEQNKSVCDQSVVISADEFQNARYDLLTINNISINGDCLTIDFGSSGCDGSTWVMKLIDSEAIAESYPPQRSLRISFKNEELCDAYFTKTLSFDIKPLRVSGNKVILHVENFEHPIIYEY